MQERSNKIVEQAPVGIITFSTTGEIDYLNQNFKKFGILYNFETTSLIGTNALNVVIFPSINITKEIQNLLSGFPFEKEIKQITTTDGRQINLIVKGSPMYDKHDVIGGILLIEDIKVLIESKEDLKLRSEYFEKAIHHVNDILMVTNVNYEVQFAAGSLLKILSIDNTKVVGTNIIDLFGGESKSLLSDYINNVIINEEPVKFELTVDRDENKLKFN